MTVRMDPEGNELRALDELVDVGGREVLEIGCGDGRLTERYVARAARVTAIEPFAPALERAGTRGLEAVEFRNVAFEDFAATTPDSRFDVVLLSWSLC